MFLQNSLCIAVIAVGPWTRGAFGLKPVALVIVGIALFASGAVAGIVGAMHLGTNRTGSVMPKADGQLVVTGIYRRIRHPLYASLGLLAVGWSLIWVSAWAFAISGILLLLLHRKAILEEGLLRKRFPDYDAHFRNVPRYIPTPW